MKKINWIIIGIVGVIVLLFLFGAGMMSNGWSHRGWGMMGGSGMMGGWGYSPFGWIGMAFMWLIPVGVIALIIVAVAPLMRNNGNSTQIISPTPCPHCEKGTQADWQNCPYCGTALK